MENVKKINIVDKNFGHAFTSSWYNKCKYFEWFRGNEIVSDVCFFTDLCLQDVSRVSKIKKKVAWLIEPKSINPSMYKWIEENHHLFDYVLTYDPHLLSISSKFMYCPHGMCWIDNFNNDPKSKMCSMFASHKTFTDGHKLRHQIINEMKTENIDFFGEAANNKIDKKEEGLNSYCYSITVENSILPGYFSEKLIDCFATKTIPIYYGDKKTVSEHFNIEGVLFFETVNELKGIIAGCTYDNYVKRLKAITENYLMSDTYRVPENWIFENYKFLFE